MSKVLYCWRCRMDIPMLDEHEWGQVFPVNAIQEIKDYRAAHDVSIIEAKDRILGSGALERYLAITGFRETNVGAIWHHRLSAFGPPCKACGKPLRTPTAKVCVEVGCPG